MAPWNAGHAKELPGGAVITTSISLHGDRDGVIHAMGWLCLVLCRVFVYSGGVLGVLCAGCVVSVLGEALWLLLASLLLSLIAVQPAVVFDIPAGGVPDGVPGVCCVSGVCSV